MPGLVPGIHVLLDDADKDVDGRDEPGHDGKLHPTGETLTALSSFWRPEPNTTPSRGETSV